MSDINDRGSIKWTSLMLPEQVKLLQQLREQQNRKTKPILDEQRIEDNNFNLQAALNNNLNVIIKYFRNYDYFFFKGKLKEINVFNKYVNTNDVKDERILLEEIIEVEID